MGRWPGRSVNRWLCFLALGAVGGAALAAQIPAATELPGKPFFVKKTWQIGGEGNWDYLALDPSALQLYVAHGPAVQVVDVGTGTLAGAIGGMRDAHGIALDDSGQFGFVTDGPANRLRIFDRRTLQVAASLPTGPNPRAVVFEPTTKLVFAICTESITTYPKVDRQGRPVGTAEQRSVITVIDAEKQASVGQILLNGKLGFALADGNGQLFVNLLDRNQIAHFSAQAVLELLSRSKTKASGTAAPPIPSFDWTAGQGFTPPADHPLHVFPLGRGCRDPRSLAVDGDHQRLFAACGNDSMQVLNAQTGQVVATLPIGPGTDAIGFDATTGLIFTANGGGLGSVTIIRQSVTDSYAVIQELPTQQRARTLAVNPANGEVYLVTNLMGFDLTQKGSGGSAHSLPIVQATPVTGSFQVLVIGN